MLNTTEYVTGCILVCILLSIGYYCLSKYVIDNHVDYYVEFAAAGLSLAIWLLLASLYCIICNLMYSATPVESTKLSTTLDMVSVNDRTWCENQYAKSTGKHSDKLQNEFIVCIENDDSTVSARTFSLETPLVVDGENKVYVYTDHHRSWLVHYDSERYELHVSE